MGYRKPSCQTGGHSSHPDSGEICSCLKIGHACPPHIPHPDDGQTKRMNAVMEQYLRAYVNYLQDDWTDHLFLAEFARNSQVSDTTTLSPFFTNLGYHTRCDFELDIQVDDPEEQRAQTAAERLRRIHEGARSEVRWFQVWQQDSADARRLPSNPMISSGWVEGTGVPSDQAGS